MKAIVYVVAMLFLWSPFPTLTQEASYDGF
jgi:hypothetical protein